MKRVGGHLTYANVVSSLCLFLLLGGGVTYAATHLGKNSVGAKQLKKNAVLTAKIKNEAITAAKVKKGTLTGAQINASTLSTVPTAQTANSLGPPEAWHMVGSPGEPNFETTWNNSNPHELESAGFYKDHEGVVHLKGVVSGGPGGGGAIFALPAGYRPASGKVLVRLTLCVGPGCPASRISELGIDGPGFGSDGAVIAPLPEITTSLEGITFRAES